MSPTFFHVTYMPLGGEIVLTNLEEAHYSLLLKKKRELFFMVYIYIISNEKILVNRLLVHFISTTKE
jgi:hypothetical protein